MTNQKIFYEAKDVSQLIENDSLKDVLPYLFHKYTGIVNGLAVRDELSKQGFKWVQLRSCNKAELFNLQKDPTSGGLGVDKVLSLAITKAFGEAIERYCVAYGVSEKKVKIDSLEETNKKILINSLSIKEKNKEILFSPIDMVAMRDFWSSREYLWPSRKIYVPFRNPQKLHACTTTGTACSDNYEDAIKHAVYEIIERDAIMVYHFLKLRPNKIKLSSIKDRDLKELIYSVNKHWTLQVLRLSTIPGFDTYVSIIYRNTKAGMRYGIGASTSDNPINSINKAIIESLTTYKFVKHIKKLRQTDVKKVYFLFEHFLFYQNNNFKLLTDYLLSGDYVDFGNNAQNKLDVFDAIKKNGHNYLLVKDITTSDIRRYTTYKVVKVVIPTLLDLSLSYGSVIGNHPRLKQMRKSLKINKTTINPLPHPMP